MIDFDLEDADFVDKRRVAWRGGGNRTGAIISIEMIIILPLAMAIALAIVQMILIATANFRLEAATVAGAELAARGKTHRDVHAAVGLTLGPLAQFFETEIEYFDTDGNGKADPFDDQVVLSARVPMETAARNYLGLLGGSVSPLHMRAVVRRPITADKAFDIPPHE
jgi:hypothetical protein